MTSTAAPSSAAKTLWPPTPGLPPLALGDRVHLVGIGGAGMSGLARALASLGLHVSGSDRQGSPETAALGAEGIAVAIGHAADHVPPGCTLVVISPAVPDDNPEVEAAARRGIPVSKRAVLLGALMDSRVGVAIAGTHGKTTTTGLVAHILRTAGADPSFFVGGDVAKLGANAHLGTGPHLVVEADEYDRTFLHFRPQVAVVTHLEHDHPDIYPTFADFTAAFDAFAAGVRPGGRLIVNAGSAATADIGAAPPGSAGFQGASHGRAGSPRSRGDHSSPTGGTTASTLPVGVTIERYHVEGDPAPPPGVAIDWRAHGIVATESGQLFDVSHGDACLGTWSIRLGGRYNVGNALAAIAAAEALRIDRAATRAALASYGGVARRFDVLGRAAGVTVVDDYAHHPTEIAAALEAARERYPGRRIVAVAQPHTYSRVAAMADGFASALAGADRVIVTPVYAAREAPIPGADAARIARGVAGGIAAADLGDAAARAVDGAEPGDVLLFLGAGDITDASRDALARLRRRHADQLMMAGAALGLGGDVRRAAAMADVTSLRVGGPADVLVRARTIDDLAGWWKLARSLDMPVRVIGRGTNVLVGDGGVHGLVIVNRCEGWVVDADADAGDQARVRCESGVTLAALGQALAREGWAGIEAGVGIPGSVGAGVVTNAGAHGWEMADSVVEAEVMGPDGDVRRWKSGDLDFRYRGSDLKGDADHLVLRVALRVTRDDPAAILTRIARFTAHRRATQPATPSVGSMFKNPAGDFAGRLIEAAGLKGTVAGGAEISSVHANFFVNRGGARAGDVVRLLTLARRSVREQFGVELEAEIERLGADDVV